MEIKKSRQSKPQRCRVSWEPIWHPGLDWLMPTQGAGSRLCATRADAEAFAARLKAEGVRVGTRAGEEIFGSELEVSITEVGQ